MNKPFFHPTYFVNVTNFMDLISTPFHGTMNAISWMRELKGDFAEIVHKVDMTEDLVTLEEEDLRCLSLSPEGQFAREVILSDLHLLKTHGAAPIINVIRSYERDDSHAFFPTDVYSFHVDRTTVPFDTFLCTYYGEPSEILLNEQAEQKILMPEIRRELEKYYGGQVQGFGSYLIDNFFDLHYQAKSNAQIISLGTGHMWKLATDHPESKVLPCIHRAPQEKNGQKRLLMIC